LIAKSLKPFDLFHLFIRTKVLLPSKTTCISSKHHLPSEDWPLFWSKNHYRVYQFKYFWQVHTQIHVCVLCWPNLQVLTVHATSLIVLLFTHKIPAGEDWILSYAAVLQFVFSGFRVFLLSNTKEFNANLPQSTVCHQVFVATLLWSGCLVSVINFTFFYFWGIITFQPHSCSKAFQHLLSVKH
jgi:hypothetical protein